MEKFIKRLQELPENKKNIILWTIVIFLGIIIFVIFINNTARKIKKFQGNYFFSGPQTSELQKNSQDVGQTIKQIQDIFNQAKNQNNDQIQSQNENETQKENTK